jgi:peptide/nickel transport system substrate-binding protein
MHRRTVLKSALAGAAALSAPAIVAAQSQRVLKFIPQSDLPTLDPVMTSAGITRDHAYMVFDTLYGLDNAFRPQPQMVDGHVVENDGKQWTLTLRDGLTFHDGTPVLARDAVASIQRWGKRDGFGQILMSVTDEISASSDKVIRFRLKKPFALLPDALAVPASMACIMPERLARSDAMTQVTEMVGSGPFRFVAAERVPGSRVTYEKFAQYVPRPNGKPEFSSGPKVVHFDRVEWTIMPDAPSAAAALGAGEFDWWENPALDLIPLLKRNRKLTVRVTDQTGGLGCMRFNQLFAPFNNPAICRLVVSAINQREFMEVVAGSVPELIGDKVGLFVPGTPMASDAGLDIMKGADNVDALKAELTAAGYKGEKVVILAASNYPTIHAVAQVGAALLQKIGFNVDYQALDWATIVQRRASKEPPEKGGWNIFFTFIEGTGNVTPASNIVIRSNGAGAWFGWPSNPKMEALREAWFDAPDLDAQKRLARDIQIEFWARPTYAPLGVYFQPTAYQSTLADVREGFAQFYGVRRV